MPQQDCVRDFMSPVSELATLRPDDPLTVADDVMHLARIRHMPVLNEADELVGLVSRRDFLCGALARAMGVGSDVERMALSELKARDVMTRELHTVTPDTPLARAAARMARHKIGCVLVLEDGVLAGILTEGDFVKRAARQDEEGGEAAA